MNEKRRAEAENYARSTPLSTPLFSEELEEIANAYLAGYKTSALLAAWLVEEFAGVELEPGSWESNALITLAEKIRRCE